MIRKKGLFVFVLLAFCISCLGGKLTGVTGTAFAQWQERRGKPGGSRMKDRAGEASEEIKQLVDMEKEDPTTSENVRERYRKLMRVIRQSAIPINKILPRAEGRELDSMIRDGNLEEAAPRVHAIIMELERFAAKQPGQIREKRPPGKEDRTTLTQPGDFVSSESIFNINIHHLANKNSFANILKLMNPAIDSDKRRLYITGTKSTSIGVVDLDKDELIETFDIGVPGGFLLVDSKTGNIYMFQIEARKFFTIDIANKMATVIPSLPSHLSLPVKGAPEVYKGYSYKDTGYPFRAGYLQNENAAYGVIEIKDSSGKRVGEIKHGPNALYFSIDQKTGKLYASNSGDGSITVFDLNNRRRKIKDIDVGTSVHEIVLNPETGSLYIRDRLGGSVIFYYDQSTKILHTIPNENIAGSRGIGMWPSQIIYWRGRVYVLSHYAGRVDVIDTITHEVTGHIPLNLSYKPRTDGISTMAMDKTRGVIYAAFPELWELAVADAKTLKHIKTLKIKKYDARTTGPANMVLSVDEKLNKLYVFLARAKRLHVYNGKTYRLEKSIPIHVERAKHVIMSNSEKGVLYVGEKILDAHTLEIKGSFPRGSRVVAFDNAKNRVYVVDKIHLGPAKNIEKVYEYEGVTLKKEWTLSPILSIPSSFAFDFKNGTFYVGYFESAVVEAFDLASGQTPTSEPVISPQRRGFRKRR